MLPDTQRRHADILREVSRIERDLVNGTSADASSIDGLVESIRGSSDDGLRGRVLSLLGRSQAAQGQHELALSTAEAGRRALDRLEGAKLRQYSALHAELLRTAGSALCKLGRVGDALPLLEDAVSTAEIGLDAVEPVLHVTEITAQHSLIRSLNTLGIALFSIGAIDTAIDVYGRALEFIDTNADMADHFLVDAALLRSNLTEVLHERAERRQRAGDTQLAAQDVAVARRLLDAQAHLIDGASLERPATGSASPRTLSPYGRAYYHGAWGQHLLMSGNPPAALASFERELLIAATVIVAGGTDVQVTSSFGVAAFDSNFDTLDHALSRADHALYAAKSACRDRVYAANATSPYLAK